MQPSFFNTMLTLAHQSRYMNAENDQVGTMLGCVERFIRRLCCLLLDSTTTKCIKMSLEVFRTKMAESSKIMKDARKELITLDVNTPELRRLKTQIEVLKKRALDIEEADRVQKLEADNKSLDAQLTAANALSEQRRLKIADLEEQLKANPASQPPSPSHAKKETSQSPKTEARQPDVRSQERKENAAEPKKPEHKGETETKLAVWEEYVSKTYSLTNSKETEMKYSKDAVMNARVIVVLYHPNTPQKDLFAHLGKNADKIKKDTQVIYPESWQEPFVQATLLGHTAKQTYKADDKSAIDFATQLQTYRTEAETPRNTIAGVRDSAKSIAEVRQKVQQHASTVQKDENAWKTPEQNRATAETLHKAMKPVAENMWETLLKALSNQTKPVLAYVNQYYYDSLTPQQKEKLNAEVLILRPKARLVTSVEKLESIPFSEGI